MIWKHSCKSCLRMGWKAVLFALLTAMATMFLYLAGNTWLSSERMLRECDEAYTTIAVLEYIGDNYPGETEYDPDMQAAAAAFDYSSITGSEHALSWEQTNLSVGSVEGMAARSQQIPYRSGCVLVVENIRYVDGYDAYWGDIVAAPYSFTEEARGKHVFLDLPLDYEHPVTEEKTFGGEVHEITSYPPLYTFDPEKRYVIAGEYTDLIRPTKTVRPTPFYSAAAAAAGVSRIAAFAEVDDVEALLSDQTNPYMQIADFYRMMNNKVYVQFTYDLSVLNPFYQELMKLNEGRLFTTEEADAGAKVCVVSETVAACTGLGIGDFIEVKLFRASGLPLSDCYWTEESIAATERYEIVGITNYVEGYQYNIYVPQPKDTVVAPGERQYFYTLGQAVLKNGSAIAFEEALSPHLTNRMLLSTYDQGYQDVADSIAMIRQTAVVLTIAASASALVVLALFGFLFIMRQRETVETMLYLGTPRCAAYGYLLFGAALLVLLSAALGACAGSLLSDRLIQSAYGMVCALQAIDLRYSNGYSGVVREFTPMSQTSPLFALAIVLMVFAAALIFCLFFAQRVVRLHRITKKRKKRARAVKPPKRSSHLPGGAWKFAVLSIRRGGMRSAAVPIAALALTLFLLTLAQTGASYNEALDALYDTAKIEGDFTAMNGKLTGNLSILPRYVQALQASGFLSEASYAIAKPYMLLADDSAAVKGGVVITSDPYAMELHANAAYSAPKLVFTTSLGTAPEFRYSTPIAAYADGFGAEMFSGVYPEMPEGTLPCLVSKQFLETHAFSFGDSFTVVCMRQTAMGYRYTLWPLQIAGSFVRQSALDNIYVPLNYTLEELSAFAFTGYEASDAEILLSGAYLNACHFELADARALGAFKDALTELGFSGPHAESFIRVAITLRDKAFNESVRDLNQRITYMEMLYPVLYAIISIVGVTVSYLVVSARREEMAIMRGVGGSRMRVFRTFFLEQALLCLAGTGAGAAAFLLYHGTFAFWREIALFVGCYLLGCALAICVLNRASTLQILGERE